MHIALGWIAVGIIDALFLQLSSNNDFVQRTALYRIDVIFLLNIITYAISGLMTGTLLVFVLRDRFRHRPFFQYLFINTGIILGLGLLLNLIISNTYFSYQLGETTFSPAVLAEQKRFFFNSLNLKNVIIGILCLFGTMIVLQVNDKYGPGIFFKLLIGRYHFPKEEERIFMFLDMKSSSTIAAKLGHAKFHSLLAQFFRDITDPILIFKGEIYQYVGDEIVITWQLKAGLRDNALIRCFFKMKEALQENRESYENVFGLIPEFKAGVHFGKVNVGEIGEIKKDLVYSGDVLSTASRIQSVCNELNSELLISKTLLNLMSPLPRNYIIKSQGEIDLRGLTKKMELISVEENGSNLS
jgi:adenylate cyclase